MKIAQVSPLYESVPPRLYGGTERVVAHLTEALIDLGHDVTLFATGDARTRARLVSVRDQALRLDPQPYKSDLAAHMALLSELKDRADEFDLIHFHTDLIHFPFFEALAGRTVTTLHGRLDLTDLPEAYERWAQYPLVSISENQRRPLAWANWAATVPHGFPTELYRFSPSSQGYLAFLGRMSPEKGPDRAIEIARRLGKPLKMAAKVDPADMAYFEEVVEPLILSNPNVEFIGEIGDAEKSEFLGGAEALLFPIDWPEPFGLVMIEAMACGVPVVAYRRGSAPEVIEDGATGFIVEGLDEACEAAARAPLLDRAAIRKRFELRFSATAMARRYLDVYRDILARRPYAADVAAPAEPKSFASLN